MAEYCWQCTEKHLGIPGDRNDFAGLASKEYEKYPTVCEGCGGTVVDHEGRCVGKRCRVHSGVLHVSDERKGLG
jgi:hypothetical protein